MQYLAHGFAINSGGAVHRYEDAALVHSIFIVASVFVAHAMLGEETSQAAGCCTKSRASQSSAANRAFCYRTSGDERPNAWNGQGSDAEQRACARTKCCFAGEVTCLLASAVRAGVLAIVLSNNRNVAIANAGRTQLRNHALCFGPAVENS
jgi:hypothetical protein